MLPTVADLKVDNNKVVIQARTNLEALMSRISPEHENTTQSANAKEYERLRKLEPAELETLFEGFRDEMTDGVAIIADGVNVPARVAKVEIPEVGDIGIIRSSRITLEADIPEDVVAVTFGWKPDFGPIVLRAPQRRGRRIRDNAERWGSDGAPLFLKRSCPAAFGRSCAKISETGISMS